MDEKIYEKAIKLLSLRMHTTGELQRKLKARGFKDQDIVPVLKELERLQFLDDQKFAEIFVDNLKRFKDFGFYGIKAKLLARQVPSDIVESVLAEFFTAEDETKIGQRVVAKLKKRGRDSYEKLARALQSRGFRNQIISAVLKN